MDFSRPYKIIPPNQSIQKVEKFFEEKITASKATSEVLEYIKQSKSISSAKNHLNAYSEALTGVSLYKNDNFIIELTDFISADNIIPINKHISAMDIKSMPKILYSIRKNERDVVLVYDLGTKQKLLPFDKTKVSDRAKSEFYEDIKKLADSKLVDSESILDTGKWFRTEEGSKIFLMNTNIGGYLPDECIEPLKKNVFNLLFN